MNIDFLHFIQFYHCVCRRLSRYAKGRQNNVFFTPTDYFSSIKTKFKFIYTHTHIRTHQMTK